MTPQGASQECRPNRPSDTRVKTAGDTWCASKKHATQIVVEQMQPLHFSHISQIGVGPVELLIDVNSMASMY
jgi:hypothetical protein